MSKETKRRNIIILILLFMLSVATIVIAKSYQNSLEKELLYEKERLQSIEYTEAYISDIKNLHKLLNNKESTIYSLTNDFELAKREITLSNMSKEEIEKQNKVLKERLIVASKATETISIPCQDADGDLVFFKDFKIDSRCVYTGVQLKDGSVFGKTFHQVDIFEVDSDVVIASMSKESDELEIIQVPGTKASEVLEVAKQNSWNISLALLMASNSPQAIAEYEKTLFRQSGPRILGMGKLNLRGSLVVQAEYLINPDTFNYFDGNTEQYLYNQIDNMSVKGGIKLTFGKTK